MKLFEDIAAWQGERAAQPVAATLGFVPTMGALHEGHVSLVRRSLRENDRTLVSIFVNPAQFNDPADLDRYPRTLASDLALVDAEGVDYVLVPPERQLYPDAYRYRVIETDFAGSLEGAHRPGHFEGVLTVVLKLLQIAGARRAYFGEKDWQQLHLIRGMAQAFFMSTEIVACPTVREHSGLAMSSRNVRLAADDKDRAASLYRVLTSSTSATDARNALEAEGFDVDYVEDRDTRRLAAVRLGGVRLIDNVSLERHS
jgi:pantoate--beta-alanine ligase